MQVSKAKNSIFRLTAATALVVVLSALHATAALSETLDGWGPFRFGMPDSEARGLAAPGQSWKYQPPLPNSDGPGLREFSWLGSLGPVNEFGTQFTIFSLAFNSGAGLNLVTFDSEKKESLEDCKNGYLKLLPLLEARYGSFAPLGNGLPPGSKVSIHDIAGGSSEYRLADVPADQGFTRGGFRMDAVHTFGARYLRVSTSDIEAPPGVSVCYTEVQFVQPQPDHQEEQSRP